ncbi:MAG: hypothetical protein ABL893_21310, partial [Hyphomicrobium sp.]
MLEMPDQELPKEANMNHQHSKDQRIVLAKWNSEECSKALREQNAVIDSKYDRLISEGYLTFEYLVGSEVYPEPEFFQRIVDSQVDVIDELRQLLKTYIGKLGEGGRQPWYTNAVPALGYAMRALVLLDVNSTDILRQYMIECDREHEKFCYHTIFSDLIRRRGWRDRSMLQLGIFMAICVEAGGQGRANLEHDGLLTAAASQTSPEEFARMVLQELNGVMDALWSDDPEVEGEAAWQLKGFCSDLNRSIPFQARVLEVLQPD